MVGWGFLSGVAVKRELYNIITVRKRSCGKVMFSQACVKNSVHRAGDVHPPWADTPFPWADTPFPWADTPFPWADTPSPLADNPRVDTPSPGQTPPRQTPPGRHPPGRRVMQRTVHILLECILVFAIYILHHAELQRKGQNLLNPSNKSEFSECFHSVLDCLDEIILEFGRVSLIYGARTFEERNLVVFMVVLL